MKRISIWALSTLSAVILLFGYSTSTSGSMATGSLTSVQSGAFSSSLSSTASSGTTSTSSTKTTAKATSTKATTTKVTGSVASTRWGPVQVELSVASGKITKVSVLQYPTGNGTDEQINGYALPILTQETIDAQSANINMVSGATVTSGGYLESLQSALDQANL